MFRMLLVCICMSPACIRMLLVCIRMLLVCYSYVLECTCMYSYVLVCTSMYSYVTRTLLVVPVCSFSHDYLPHVSHVNKARVCTYYVISWGILP